MKRFSLATACATALLLGSASVAHAETIFVSNEKDNTITVVDGETLKTIDTIKTARRPRGIVLSPDFKELFVAATSSTSLTPKRSKSPASWKAVLIQN